MVNARTMGASDTDDLSALQDARTKVLVGITVESESNFYVGFTERVSDGGVFVATHAPMRIGCAIDLEIELPGHSPFLARGTVRWVREYSEANDTAPGMGIRFDHLSDQEAPRIHEFAAVRPPIFFDDEPEFEQVPSPRALVG